MERRYLIPATSYTSAISWSAVFAVSFLMVCFVPLVGLIFVPTLLAIIPAVWLGVSVTSARSAHQKQLNRFLVTDFDTTLTGPELSSILSLSEGALLDVMGPSGCRLRIERLRDELIVKEI